VHADFEYIGQAANLVTVCLYGGTQYNTQEMVLRRVRQSVRQQVVKLILNGSIGISVVCDGSILLQQSYKGQWSTLL
jgi:hypothetical protein